MSQFDEMMEKWRLDLKKESPSIIFVDYSDKLSSINKLQSQSRIHRGVNVNDVADIQSLIDQDLELKKLIRGEFNG